MRTVKHLPRRPLRMQDVQNLDDDSLQLVPYGGVPEGDDVQIYAVKLAVGNTAFALGFDAERTQWRQLASVDATELAAADRQLDAVLDGWVQEKYGGEFEVLKAA
jgi:hypothetical protein